MKRLSKTDFADYCHCPKTFWLRRRRPEAIAWPKPSAIALTRMRDGQAVEGVSRGYVEAMFGADHLRAQLTFETDTLIARADFVRAVPGMPIDIFEVKASTSLKDDGDVDHIVDAAFQVLVAERQRHVVGRVFIIHLNKDYAYDGELDITRLFTAVDVTARVRERLAELTGEIDAAANWLALDAIDEDGCECRFQGVNRRCDAFAYFNPDIEADSAHWLPRIRANKLREMAPRFGLDEIDPADLSPPQQRVWRAYREGPVIDRAGVADFLGQLEFPLHFYDYETTAPAVPPAAGYRAFQALPVQFSLHRLSADGDLEHFEWLADGHGQQRALVDALEGCVGHTGSAISWNKGYEIGCNRRLAALLMDKAAFLARLDDRTVDLEDPFKVHYVDWRFRGSTSIKKVLPTRQASQEREFRNGDQSAVTKIGLTDCGARHGQFRGRLRRKVLSLARNAASICGISSVTGSSSP
jgi:hypothetical protein